MNVVAVEPRVLVLGVGNPQRGDDGVGPCAVRCFTDLWRGPSWPGLRVASIAGEATALLDQLEQADHVFIIDACHAGASPGALLRFDAHIRPLPARHFTLSSHGPGLAEALELARALDVMPAQCIVYAIEGESYAPGAPLSCRAKRGAMRAVIRIQREIRGLARLAGA